MFSVLASFVIGHASAEVVVRTRDELRAALRDAKPGTTIRLSAGDYQSIHAERLEGTKEAPIRLLGDAASPARFTGIHLTDPVHVELEHLLVERGQVNGINIDDGGTFDTPAHHVTLRNVTVRDCGDRGNVDGIKLSGLRDFLIESCTVERWGRGGSAIDMVGCRDGKIERCTLRDSEKQAASTGVQAKGGSESIEIRECRFEHAGDRAVNIGGSTGLEFFRPKPQGFEARKITVEHCTFIGSMSPIAFVGVDGSVVRRNTFYRPRKWLVRILQETRAEGFVPCRNGVFSENLIAYRRDEMRTTVNVGDRTAPETFRFDGNYWFAIDDPAQSVPNLPVAEVGARGGRDPGFRDAPGGDFGLSPDSPARGCGR